MKETTYNIPRDGWFYKNGKYMTVKYEDGTIMDVMPHPTDTDMNKFNMIKNGEMISGQACRIYFSCDFKLEIFDFGKTLTTEV